MMEYIYHLFREEKREEIPKNLCITLEYISLFVANLSLNELSGKVYLPKDTKCFPNTLSNFSFRASSNPPT